MTHHDKSKFDELKEDIVSPFRGKEEKKEIQVEKGVKESDFNKEKKGNNLNKVGIKSASNLNAIDSLDTTFADVGQGGTLEVKLAEEYENIKALKVKFVSKRGPFKFRVNDSDKEFESKALKNDAEIFELDEPIDGNCICIKPTGANGAEIVDVQVFVEGDPNKCASHNDRNPEVVASTKSNKKEKGDKK
jgi:hypothetical protein